jgi:catechol 2,3-dioxygenase-like lactoylglutathione lyase family enzyme
MAKINDIAYVAYRCPDLDLAERFLGDFGMVRAARTADALFMRGAGPRHHLYVARKGETAGFDGVAFSVASAADLAAFAALPGASAVAAIDEPGGGQRVTLSDPDGFRVDIVHGIASLPELPMHAPPSANFARVKNRRGAPYRVRKGPAQILRLGHVLLKVRDFQRTFDWYTQNLGMLPSDVLVAGPEKKNLVAFLRCDRGSEFTDHHTLAFAEGPVAHLHHSSFEINDFDDQVLGHEWLQSQGWRNFWGIGRHVIGSQVFDYWKDPFGNTVEHYADGDLFDATKQPEYFPASPEYLSVWGPEAPVDFFD